MGNSEQVNAEAIYHVFDHAIKTLCLATTRFVSR
jgi:hypothetical protein